MLLLDAVDELRQLSAVDVKVLARRWRPFLLDLVDQVPPGLLFDACLMRAAGREDDLDAFVADRADGHVLQVVRIDASLERCRQVFGLELVAQFLALLHLLVLVDFVNQDGASYQVYSQLESALSLLVAMRSASDGDGSTNSGTTQKVIRQKKFRM